MTLDDILGNAYTIDQMGRDRRGAVALLREKIAAEPDIKTAAEAELARLAAVVRVRSRGSVGVGGSFVRSGRDGCHISAVCHDLLQEALAP